MIELRHVVLVHNSLVHAGGVECRALELVRYLRARGTRVRCIVLRQSGPVAERLAEAGAEVVEAGVYRYENGRNRVSMAGLMRLRTLLQEGAPDAILALQPPGHYLVRMALFGASGPGVVAMERLTYAERSPKLVLADHLLGADTRCWVTVSRALRDEVRARSGLPADRILAVEDGVAAEQAGPVDCALREWAGARWLVGWIGSLSVRKRPRVFLEALARWREAAGDVAVGALVGPADDEAGLEEHAESLGLAGAVRFLGSRTDPWPALRAFDVLLFPSVLEGLGNVWVEALFAGCPVVACDLPPMNGYLIHGENALLCPPDNSTAFAQSLARLHGDATLRHRLVAAGRITAESTFQPERQIGRLLALAADPPGC